MWTCNFLRNNKVKPDLFHAHFAEGVYKGESPWEVRSIDEAEGIDNLRWKESY